MVFHLSVFIGICVFLIISYLVASALQSRLNSIAGETNAGWVVRVQNDSLFLHAHNFFESAEDHDRQLTPDEILDEAASFALFTAYETLNQQRNDGLNVEKGYELGASSIIIASHPQFGDYYFYPDYEQGYLVGVVQAKIQMPTPKQGTKINTFV